MNQQAQHAFEPEEIMAYLDGELAPGRALEVATHLDHCAECARLAEGIRSTSAQLREWSVGAPSPKLDEAIAKALSGAPLSPRRRNRVSALKDWWRANGWMGLAKSPFAWSGVAFVLVVILVGGAILRRQASTGIETFFNGSMDEQAHSNGSDSSLPASQGNLPRFSLKPASPPPPAPSSQIAASRSLYQASDQLESRESQEEENNPQLSQITAPMIAQTASVTIVPANYDQASAALEALAKSHGGYVQKLDASAQAGQARAVSATLRIPAAQLGDFLADAKKLGRVVQFSQENEEVTDQYVDVEARLKSARATEQRLIDLQATRTGKLSDVLEVERELERVRAEIEQMDGERAVLVHRVQYASVDLSLQEEYRQNLRSDSSSKLTVIWNAVVDGFRNLEDGVVSLLVFLLAYGPSILFWLAIVAVPAWLIWRRCRSRSAGK